MKAKGCVSAFVGIGFGVVAYFVLAYLNIPNAVVFAALAGLLFYFVLFAVFIIYEKALNKKYAALEKQISSPIFYKTNGNFNLGNGRVKNGNIYFCEAGIVCVCLEDKPYTLDEILLQDIDGYQFDNIHLTVFAKDGRTFVITTADTPNIIEKLKEKHWVEAQ